MTKIIFSSLIFSLIVSAECRMIYQRYEKENLEKNYIQVVEIFESFHRPPHFIENEKELNDFLGKDAFKTDMNCSTVTTEKTTTTTKPFTIPTTAYRQPSPTTPNPVTTLRPPNLDHLFTIKPTKPTFRPNPKENENPDYTELYNWQKNHPKPNVQVTKHLPTTIKPPLIVIKETDVQVTKNQTDSGRKNVETTTVIDSDNENYDEDDNGTGNYDGENDDYDPNSYDLANENDHNQLSDDENFDSEEEDDETKERRKRLSKTRRRRKHIQSTKSLISKKS